MQNLNSMEKMTDFCESISDRLDFAMECKDFGVFKGEMTSYDDSVDEESDTAEDPDEHKADSKANANEHPPLEDEPKWATKVFKEEIFPPLNAKLFEILASMHTQGATLSGFAADGVADAASVGAWMNASW